MRLDFTEQKYYEKALALAKGSEHSFSLTQPEAFNLLIHGTRFGQLDQLIRVLKEQYPAMTEEAIYQDLQADSKRIPEETVLSSAYETLERFESLGSELVNNINISHYLGHSLWESKLCGQLATLMGLDADRAAVMGMLHDYGRREVHTLFHVIRGFELLTDLGYWTEGLSCLTHSFLNACRCASNEPAEPGFYVNAQGDPCWEDGTEKDQMTLFLEACTYTDYERILNLADLMAVSLGIVSPFERLTDVMRRRVMDPVNRGFFMVEFIRLLNDISRKARFTCYDKSIEDLRFAEGSTIDEMMQLLLERSKAFYQCYLQGVVN